MCNKHTRKSDKNIACFGALLLCPYLHSFGRTASPPTSAAVPIAPRGLSGIGCRPVQRVQRPGVCVGAPCLAWSVLCSLSGCAGAGASTGGVYSRRPAPPGQSLNHRKNKKDPPNLHKSKPIRLCKSPNFPKKAKRPLTKPRLRYNQLKAMCQRKEESK